MDKNTFSILFAAQKDKLKADGKALIMYRITINRESVSMATRLSVLSERWLGKECRTPGKTNDDKNINEMLDNYRNVIRNKYNEVFFRGKSITATGVKPLLAASSPARYSMLSAPSAIAAAERVCPSLSIKTPIGRPAPTRFPRR